MTKPKTGAQRQAALRDKGRVARGRIGVVIQEVTRDLATSFGLDRPRGALVNSVEKGSPADKAGVEATDIILGYDDSECSHAALTLLAWTAFSANIRNRSRRRWAITCCVVSYPALNIPPIPCSLWIGLYEKVK